MPSPFPGMNPYVERASVWHDFHERWIPLAADLIGAQVLPRYFVRIDEHMYIHELASEERRFIDRGDILVPTLAPGVSPASQVLEAPAEVRLPVADTECLSFLEIRDRDSRELVTVVELLSPSNKYAGPDREQYLVKALQLQRNCDARLDLQHVLDRVYDAATYAYHIYTGQPEPQLSEEDAAWAQQFLAAPVPSG
jgi:hypothetical protein